MSTQSEGTYTFHIQIDIDETQTFAYQMGDGTRQDKSESRRLLAQASQSFDSEATKRLGDSLLESDPQTALKHYESAARAGHIEAAYIAAAKEKGFL